MCVCLTSAVMSRENWGPPRVRRAGGAGEREQEEREEEEEQEQGDEEAVSVEELKKEKKKLQLIKTLETAGGRQGRKEGCQGGKEVRMDEGRRGGRRSLHARFHHHHHHY